MSLNVQMLVKCIVAVAVLSVGLILAQMWFTLFPAEIFWKLLVTLVLLGALVSFLIAVKQDLSEEKKLRDDKYLD